MFLEDDNNQPKPNFIPGQALDDLSVEEIEETIKLLHEEISRLQQAKDEKTEHLSAAEALFGSKK